ncbi:UDP-N-acetylmuramoyl-L-alanine--D-glutamate ligase [Thalassospiraceae bacterium LMO-JJ14]|nr:UDP-N-acetylmuramoyl-L-alanine--D-glutamate ligase [Thalassospiraceae bacterium LMO-JJ14]
MIEVFPFDGLPTPVLGLGRSGLAAARALYRGGAEVWAWDDNEDSRNRAAEEEGIEIVDLATIDWREVTSLILSPGIPHTHPKPHPIVRMARDAGCEIIGDVELLARTQRDAAYVGITGTNGKSTTTALIGHIFQVSGREAEIGGNLGMPACALEPLGPDGTYILEMSSYQLELTFSITFDVGVLLNISADHLERHGGMDGYIAAKRQIFHRQTKPRTAVIGIDDDFSRRIYEELYEADEQLVVGISAKERVHGGVYVIDGILHDDTEGKETPVMDLKTVASLQGVHNWQNAAAAYAACKMTGIAPHAVMACINSYPGLVHRQEPVQIVDGVGFVNDSKATNGDAAARALACYDDIYWIAGGRPKEGGLMACAPYLDRVRKAFLVGEAALQFSQELDGKVPFVMSGDIETATRDAFQEARKSGLPGAVVLLSPACASFDQFSDFEARGDAFKDVVEALPGEHMDPFEEPGVFPGSRGAA